MLTNSPGPRNSLGKPLGVLGNPGEPFGTLGETSKFCLRKGLHVPAGKNPGHKTLPPGSSRELLRKGGEGAGSPWEPLGRLEFVRVSLKMQENCISKGSRDPRLPQTSKYHSLEPGGQAEREIKRSSQEMERLR